VTFSVHISCNHKKKKQVLRDVISMTYNNVIDELDSSITNFLEVLIRKHLLVLV